MRGSKEGIPDALTVCIVLFEGMTFRADFFRTETAASVSTRNGFFSPSISMLISGFSVEKVVSCSICRGVSSSSFAVSASSYCWSPKGSFTLMFLGGPFHSSLPSFFLAVSGKMSWFTTVITPPTMSDCFIPGAHTSPPSFPSSSTSSSSSSSSSSSFFPSPAVTHQLQ